MTESKYLLMTTAHGLKSVPLSQLHRSLNSEDNSGVSVSVAYRDVPWVYRSVNMIADAVTTTPFALMIENRTVATEASVEDVMGTLNANLPHLLNQWAGDLLLYGAAYWHVERNRYGVRRKVNRLHPTTLTAVYDARGEITTYERTVNGTRHRIAPENIGVIWLPNREFEQGAGSPPVVAAMHAAGVLHNAARFGEQFFQHGAVGPTIIEVDGFSMKPTQEQDRLRRWFERFATGIRNAARVLVYEQGIRLTQMGHPLRELAVPELDQSKRQDVAAAFGVPYALLFSEASNFATAAQDNFNFYDKTVVPLCRLMESALNSQLFMPQLGMRLRFQPERLEVYQERELEKAQKLDSARDRGDISREEWRQAMGFERVA